MNDIDHLTELVEGLIKNQIIHTKTMANLTELMKETQERVDELESESSSTAYERN